MKYPTYTEHYFPPPGHSSHGAAARGEEPTSTWFPLHLLLDQLGRCCMSGCRKPATYVFAGLGESPATCVPVCDDDVCGFAAMTPEGHDGCPKCHMAWAEGENLPYKAAEPEIREAGPAPIVPDEVKRLRLAPGDKLIVRVSDTWTPHQIREYQDYLQHAVPDNQVLVLPGEQILTAGPGEPQGDEAAPDDEPPGILTIEWPTGGQRYPVISPVELVVRDAATGESLVGVTRMRIDIDPGSDLTATVTEILGESGNPIRQHNQREREAETDAGTGVKTITRRYVLARRLLTDGDYASGGATTASD